MAPSNPCSACSWTAERQNHCSYKSQIKLFYEAGNRGVWSLGTNLILKDRGASSPPTSEVPNIQFVQNETSIPVPAVVESWEEEPEPGGASGHGHGHGDGHILIIMKRIPGEPLSRVWPDLSASEREGVARQTVGYLLQLRRLQSDKVQGLGGRPVCSNFLFMAARSDLSHGPLVSDDELWADMEHGLSEETVPEAARRRLRKHMPAAAPYTFTHCDLTNVNIMVENGRLTGIIDWEMSGYFPVWWEYACTSVAESEADREWKILLREFMPDYSAAREFWLDYYYLCRDPKHERSVKFLEDTKNETCTL